jgi:hypothetical protein
VIASLRLLCELKTIYKLISFVLQRLNSFLNDRNVKIIFIILIKLEIRDNIKYRFKEQQLDERMRDAIVHILD